MMRELHFPGVAARDVSVTGEIQSWRGYTPADLGALAPYRVGSRVSGDMRCKPAYFIGNTGAIDSEADHGSMSTADFPTM
jgi:hypothetical protein